MARKKTLTWKSSKSEGYEDRFSEDGRWWAAEGYDEQARIRKRQPVLLMSRTVAGKGPWRRVDTFASFREALGFAEELA